MRMSRRSVLYGIGGGVEYSYTGTFDAFGDASQGYLVLKTSGTLTIKGTVDLCLVGGGGRGANAESSHGSAGGSGGFVQSYLTQDLDDSFSVTIGAGSSTAGVSGEQTKIGTAYTANGGNSAISTKWDGAVTGRGTGGNGGVSPFRGGKGEDGVFPWDDSVNFASYKVSGCGGGGAYDSSSYINGLGGAGGGGNGGTYASGNGVPGTPNTGGGGGGGARSSGKGGSGGSGIVLVRWGY